MYVGRNRKGKPEPFFGVGEGRGGRGGGVLCFETPISFQHQFLDYPVSLVVMAAQFFEEEGCGITRGLSPLWNLPLKS